MVSNRAFSAAVIALFVLLLPFRLLAQMEQFFNVNKATSFGVNKDGSYMAYAENGILHVIPTRGERTDILTLKNNIDEIKWCEGNLLCYIFHDKNFSGIGLADLSTKKQRELAPLGESALHLAEGCNFFNDHVYYTQQAPAGTLSIMKVSVKGGKPAIVSEENPSVKKLWIDENGNAFARQVRKEKKLGLELNDETVKGGWKWIKTLGNHLQIEPLMRNKENGFVCVISNEHSELPQLEYLVDEVNYKQLTNYKRNKVLGAHFDHRGVPLFANTNAANSADMWRDSKLYLLLEKLKSQQVFNPIIVASDTAQKNFIIGSFMPGNNMPYHFATTENGLEQQLTEASNIHFITTDIIDPANQTVLARLFSGQSADLQSPCVLMIPDINDPVSIDDYDSRVAYLNSQGLSVLKVSQFGAFYNGQKSNQAEMSNLVNKDFSSLKVLLKQLSAQIPGKPSAFMIFGEGTGCLPAAYAAMNMPETFAKVVLDEPIMDLTAYCDRTQGKSRTDWCASLEQEIKLQATDVKPGNVVKILVVTNPQGMHDGNTTEVIASLKEQNHQVVETPLSVKDNHTKEMSAMLLIANFLR